MYLLQVGTGPNITVIAEAYRNPIKEANNAQIFLYMLSVSIFEGYNIGNGSCTTLTLVRFSFHYPSLVIPLFHKILNLLFN